jgi:hypothetical protein
MLRSISNGALGTLVVLVAAQANAEPTVTPFVVDSDTYVAVEDSGSAAVLADPARAELALPAGAAGPDCTNVNRTLGAFARTAAVCKAGSTSPTCNILKDLIDRVRVDQGPVGQRRLAQAWRVVPKTAVISNGTAVREAAELATGAERIQLVTTPQPTGVGHDARASIKEGGTSWASMVSGWIDLSTPGFTFDEATGNWITRDNLLACGIVAGEVEMQWEQPIELSPQGSPLSAADLVRVYAKLQTAEPLAAGTALQQTFSLGAEVGVALQSIGVVPTAAQAAGRFVFAHLYSPTLTLLPLTEAELRALAALNVVRPEISWIAAIRR